MTDAAAAAPVSTILTVEGLAAVHTALSAIGDDVSDLGDALMHAASLLGLRARLGVHSQTYALAASITPLATALAAEVVSTSVYAEVQEWGWPAHNIEPMAYAQHAIIEGWPKVRDELTAAIAAIVAEHGAGE